MFVGVRVDPVRGWWGCGSRVFLTRREYEVLEHVADRCPNRVSLSGLWVCEDTVKTHVRGVLRKLRVSSGERGPGIWRSAEASGEG